MLPIFSKLFKPKKPVQMLAIDLGTDAVKAALFIVSDEGEIKILGQSKQKQGLTSMRGQKLTDFDAVLETVNLAAEAAELNSNVKVKKVVLGTSGLIQSVGMTVRLKRPEPEKEIVQKELDYLFQKIEEKTVNKARESLPINPPAPPSATGRADAVEEYELVGSIITSTRINDQKVATPIGLTGPTLEISLMHNFCDKTNLAALQRLTAGLGLEIFGLAETTVALAQTLLDKYETAILIDIGGEITEVVIFKNGKIIGNKVFSLGGRNLSRLLAKKLSLSFEQAEKIKHDLAEGFLDAERARDVREIVSSHFELWVKGLETVLAEYSNVRPLPALFLVNGGGSALEEVRSVLISHPWNRILPFSSFPKIERLKADPLEALGKTII